MSPMAKCVRRVEMLSKSELRSEARRLSGLVQENVARLVAHLAEIGRRGLPLEWGYAGLFEYCQKSLGMSEAEAGLRMQVAGVVRWCPALLDALAEGRMTLTVAGRLAPHLTEENAGTLIAECCGMTRNQVAEYVVQFRPKPVVSSGISKAPGGDGSSLWGDGGAGAADRSGEGGPDAGGGVADRSGGGRPVADGGAPGGSASASGETGPTAGGLEASADGRGAGGSISGSVSGSGSSTASGSGADRGSSLGANAGGASTRRSGGARGGRGSIEAAEPGKFNVRFPAKRELKEKIDRLAEVLGFDHAGRNLEAIFEQAVEIALEKKDPRRKAERRAARAERAARKESREVKDGEAKEHARSADESACKTPSRPDETCGESVSSSWLDKMRGESASPSWLDKMCAESAPSPWLDKTTDSKSGLPVAWSSSAEARDPESGGTVISSWLDETCGFESRAQEGSLCPAKTGDSEERKTAVRSRPDERTAIGARRDLHSRYVPEALRALVLEKASYRCEYVSPEGRRCEQTTRLEIDHVKPYAKGGSTEVGNLRCLCRSHNLWAAEREFGEEFIRRRIEEAGGGEGVIAEAPAVAYRSLRRREFRASSLRLSG